MINLNINEFNFKGLKLVSDNNFPWRNKKERSELFDKLYEDLSDVSKEKLKFFIEEELKENIHINLSKYFINDIIQIVFGLMAFVGLFLFSWIFVLNTLLISVIFGLLKFISHKKAKNQYQEIFMTKSLLDFCYDVEKEKNNE